MHEKIVIFDFGSQYTQLIARRLRELHYYAEIYPFYEAENIIKNSPRTLIKGIIFSGGPRSVYEKEAPLVPKSLLNQNIPILGICYGLQLICYLAGGKVEATQEREYGAAQLQLRKKRELFEGMSSRSIVWMSHGDKVSKLPKNFEVLATTKSSPFAAIGNSAQKIFGVQFHPEVQHTQEGKILLKNFAEKICGMKATWTMKNFAKEKIRELRELIGNERVLLGLSGGVDSTVTAKLLHEAIGERLSCVYVDTGLMRLNETQAVTERFKRTMGIQLHVVQAEKVFLTALEGIKDPEQKRKIIGRLFLEEFRKKALELGHHEFLAQGTLYTDVIESTSVKGPSETIKSHHNRVHEVLELMKAGRVIEPLRELFKDEVRRLGLTLKIPREILLRHPFPGPGLAIRILGEVTPERVHLLQKADAILLEELKKNKLYSRVWQAFAVFLPVRSVGVMGDQRTYENVIALRMVESLDGMTADFARVPYDFLARVANRIINEVKGVNRVVYDISSKPPATIEWE